MNLDILYKNIGKEYSTDLLGCVMPIYLLYKDIPKYEYKDDKEYFVPLVEKYFEQIDKKFLENGDLIIFNIFNKHHFCIYAGKGNAFHCTKDKGFRLFKIEKYLKYVEGYYRYKLCQKH